MNHGTYLPYGSFHASVELWCSFLDLVAHAERLPKTATFEALTPRTFLPTAEEVTEESAAIQVTTISSNQDSGVVHHEENYDSGQEEILEETPASPAPAPAAPQPVGLMEPVIARPIKTAVGHLARRKRK